MVVPCHSYDYEVGVEVKMVVFHFWLVIDSLILNLENEIVLVNGHVEEGNHDEVKNQMIENNCDDALRLVKEFGLGDKVYHAIPHDMALLYVCRKGEVNEIVSYHDEI